ncbi:DNA polymerase III subunit beta [Methylophilaceae bacterium]|jgi:DNA polymerase-3 subunit beta|nr:DNA polymerase III subunit beta [Methylophilaceae bacterium]|tara:strand:- start:7281 stop:8381 length:1101 start_codon:yes stop_codon:yes gene_type:complete
MNIKIDRELLLTPLGNVSGIVEKRHALPILSNLLLEGNGGKLKFTATDLEMQISTHVATEITDNFQLTISAKKLFDITRALPESSKIDIQIEDTKVIVKAKKSRFNLQTLPPQDYPLMKKDENDIVELTLPQNEFKALLKQVDFAMAQQDIRYYLNGLLIEVKDNNINIVGTDGHRLSFTSLALKDPTKPVQIIVPRKTIVELVKLLNDTDDLLEISFSNNQAAFKFNDIDLITKVIDGKFPDYSRVIPQGHNNFFDIERALLLDSMLRASILSNDKYRGIRMVIEEGNLKLVSNNSEQEQAEEELEIDYKGEKIDIGFNVTYLIDVLTNIQSQKLTIAFSDSSSSCLVTIPNNEKYKYVVMPMRI